MTIEKFTGFQRKSPKIAKNFMNPTKVKITNKDKSQPLFGLFTNRIAVVVGYVCNGNYEEATLVLKDGRFITATLENIVMYNTEQLVLW